MNLYGCSEAAAKPVSKLGASNSWYPHNADHVASASTHVQWGWLVQGDKLPSLVTTAEDKHLHGLKVRHARPGIVGAILLALLQQEAILPFVTCEELAYMW